MKRVNILIKIVKAFVVVAVLALLILPMVFLLRPEGTRTKKDGVVYLVEYKNAEVVGAESTLTTANIAAKITYNGKTHRVVSVLGSAFYGCTSLTSITVDPANTYFQSIDGNLYNKAGTTLVCYAPGKTETSFSIPSSVTSIGDEAFWGCTALANITIPSSVTSIGDEAFYGCTSLANITIPSSVTSIKSYAFRGCTALTSITIPSSVTSIGNWAFGGCTALTSIIIPSSVTSIVGWAFGGCTALTIYAEAAKKPTNWDSDWNSKEWEYSNKSRCPVYWFSATAPTGTPATGNEYWHYVDGVPTKW